MIEELKADLATLSDSVPLVARAIDSAVHEAEGLEHAADDLLKEVAEARQQAAAQLAAVREALPPFTVQVEADEKRVQAAGDEAEKAWDEAREAITAAEHRLEGHVEHVLSARTELQAALAEAGTKVDQSSREGDTAVGRLEHAAEEAEKRFKAGAQEVGQEVTQLKQFVDAARSSLQAACEALEKRLLEMGEHLEQEATRILGEVTAKTKDHVEHVHAPLTALVDHAHQGVQEAAERGKKSMSGPVEEAGQDIRNELERVDATADKHEEGLRTHAQGFEQALTELESEAHPMPAGLEQIDTAARQLGI